MADRDQGPNSAPKGSGPPLWRPGADSRSCALGSGYPGPGVRHPVQEMPSQCRPSRRAFLSSQACPSINLTPLSPHAPSDSLTLALRGPAHPQEVTLTHPKTGRIVLLTHPSHRQICWALVMTSEWMRLSVAGPDSLAVR